MLPRLYCKIDNEPISEVAIAMPSLGGFICWSHKKELDKEEKKKKKKWRDAHPEYGHDVEEPIYESR